MHTVRIVVNSSFWIYKNHSCAMYNQGVREGTMDRKFNFKESQTLGTGLKGICTNTADSY